MSLVGTNRPNEDVRIHGSFRRDNGHATDIGRRQNLTHCMVRPCGARGFHDPADAVLHQCIRPLIGEFVLRAIMGISARAISLADRLSGPCGHQCSHAPGRPILHLVSNPLADLGRLGVSTIRVESRGLNLAGLEGSAMSQDAPSNAGELIGERDGKDVVMQSLLRRLDPRLKPIALPMLWPHLHQHHPGRLDEQGAQIAIAPF
jgi:hypothetical protein